MTLEHRILLLEFFFYLYIIVKIIQLIIHLYKKAKEKAKDFRKWKKEFIIREETQN